VGSKWTLERLAGGGGGGGVGWIHRSGDRDHWPASMNALMNPQVLAPQS
jgi:hypothetical protein